MQREMDFSERNIRSWWFEVKDFWNLLEEEVKRLTKKHLERALVWEQRLRVGCGRYKRSKGRQGYRNGSYVRNLLSSYGWIEGLEVPRIREGGIDFQLLERYRRRQRQVDLVLLEAFLLGHSTRKVVRWFKRLFGGSISAQAVSNIAKELDQKVKEFHQRPVGG
jgi:putative transposase